MAGQVGEVIGAGDDPGAHAVGQCHADRSGSNAYNNALSLKRAASVKTALVKDGIADKAITTTGKGEEDPLVQTADGVREPQNRRVQISLQ